MIRFDRSRLRRVEPGEVIWRLRQAADIAVGRVLTAAQPPAWRRENLASRLVASSDMAPVIAALKSRRWRDAHVALAHHAVSQPARFVIAPAMRATLAAAINRHFPTAREDAQVKAERLLSGRYQLLGYVDLPFDGRHWHSDIVHGKSAPAAYWSTVPYLSPECGDHKVTWELNRHQHWLELGRAYWLTGDTRYRGECLQQLRSWLLANPPLTGINWASMLELAFRSISWLWALNLFAEHAEGDDEPWTVDLLLALDRQLTHVERHLSYYFSPNTHLLGEALALYVCGRALPMLRGSARRAALGRRVLHEEIGRQIAADGGHCERSTHYHRYTLDFYLLASLVAAITDDPVAASFERVCARLAHAARLLADDRGVLPHLGDDDGGSLFPITRRPTDDVSDSLAAAALLTGHSDLLVSEAPEEACWLLGHSRFTDAWARLGRTPGRATIGSAALAATGYYVSRTGRGDHLTIDAGPFGYLNGGHAHADALSLTFAHAGAPLLIDPGTACYTIEPHTRDRFRSTAMHNTLTVNRRSQAEPRGAFHWHAMPDGAARRWRTHDRFDYFAGVHHGYAPFAHHRHVLALHGDLLIVADCVTAAATAASREVVNPLQATLHWHIHPQWRVEVHQRHALLTGPGALTAHVAGGSLAHHHADDAAGLGWWSPAYGRIEPAHTLRVEAHGATPLWIATVFTVGSGNAVHEVTIEPVVSMTGALSHGAALRIVREHSTDHFVVTEADAVGGAARWRYDYIESDARMLLMRNTAENVADIAIVDATTLVSERDRELAWRHGSPVSATYLEGGLHAASVERKAS